MEKTVECLTADPATTAKPASALPEMSRSSLIRLRAEGDLSASALDEALIFCGFRPGAVAWRLYGQLILLLGGALFFVAGGGFFIAANWADMHRFTRMALVGVAVAGMGLGAVWRGPDTPVGKALILSCGISVGPLLAVFGQTYQTGSELWELFRVWTIVLFALALAGKQPALWFVTWLSANVFAILWLGRAIDSPLATLGIFGLLPEFVLSLAVAISVWELSARAVRQTGAAGKHEWLQSRWLPRFFFFDLTMRLTVYLCNVIFGGGLLRSQAVFLLPHDFMLVLALVVAGVSWFWYYNITPDLFMLACLVFTGEVLIVAALLKGEFLFSAEIGGVLLWGVFLVGLTAGAAYILLALQRSIAKKVETGGEMRPGPRGTSFFAPAGPLPDWNALWGHLKSNSLLPDDAPLPKECDAIAQPPWYVRGILALSGWVAALVLLIFLVLFLFVSLDISDNYDMVLLLSSLVPLALGLVCLRNPGIFLRNLGFSLALTGTAGVCIGLAWVQDFAATFSFTCAMILACLCCVMHSSPYRFLAALCIVQLVAFGISSQGFDWRLWGLAMLKPPGYALHAAILWWGGVCCGLAIFSLRESSWRGLPWGAGAQAFFFGAYGGIMTYIIAAMMFRANWGGRLLWEMYASAPPAMLGVAAVGLGAAVGLICLAYGVVNGQAKGKGSLQRYALVSGCAVLSLPLGWFLPGVALAAFGLALSRYLGSLVIQGASCTFLLVYMIYYYYFLGISLLHKALFLAATGAVLLALAFCLNRFKGACHA